MPLYIRDDDVRTLAQQVARARRTTVTNAVREALQRELGNLKAARMTRDAELRRLFATFDASPPEQDWGDAEMYDADGLPR